jgi:hypothetical protein
MKARQYQKDQIEAAIARINQEREQTPEDPSNHTEQAEHVRAVLDMMNEKNLVEIDTQDLSEPQRRAVEQYVEPTYKP